MFYCVILGKMNLPQFCFISVDVVPVPTTTAHLTSGLSAHAIGSTHIIVRTNHDSATHGGSPGNQQSPLPQSTIVSAKTDHGSLLPG